LSEIFQTRIYLLRNADFGAFQEGAKNFAIFDDYFIKKIATSPKNLPILVTLIQNKPIAFCEPEPSSSSQSQGKLQLF